MEFHLAYHPKPLAATISHDQKLLLIGSCFTEQMGNKLTQHKFQILDNPNGILFNPVSITSSVKSYISNRKYTEADLFYQNECWNSWHHHSRFSHPDKEECLTQINWSRNNAHDFLKEAGWLVLTLGSAFVYQLEDGSIAANCHKVSIDKFDKRLLSIEEVIENLDNMILQLLIFNPGIRIIFTISPVRHLRDGFVENNRSKAVLINAVHRIVEKNDRCFYFPAYELIIDDLRDYRFYAEDMVHPNYAATNYVWGKFISTCIDEPSHQLMRLINEINAARQHKPFHPSSAAHLKFLRTYLEKVKELKAKYPYLDFREEMEYFS